jgi:hypothetical protein
VVKFAWVLMVIISNGMHKEKKIFFKSEADRNLWIKLNAELIGYFQETVNHKKKEDLGSVDKPYSHMWVSNNQLTYDEFNKDAPRFSLEELLTLSLDDLIRITRKQHKEFVEKHFTTLFGVDDIDDEDLI